MESESDRPGPVELRASDKDRDAAIEMLAAAAGDGRLTLEEYTERADRALAARLRGELEDLTRDLAAADEAVSDPGPERLLAVFGNESRKGRWLVPKRLSARSLFGDCHIELQDAAVTAPVTEIKASATFGAVTIFVPDGVDVRLSGRAIFGSKSSQVRDRPARGAPVIDVRASAIFGSVTVRPARRRGRAQIRR